MIKKWNQKNMRECDMYVCVCVYVCVCAFVCVSASYHLGFKVPCRDRRIAPGAAAFRKLIGSFQLCRIYAAVNRRRSVYLINLT